jgi:uncharacterized protein YegJ (DUF2314 family)
MLLSCVFLACVFDDQPASVRVRLGQGGVSIEIPKAARRRWVGEYLVVHLPEAGDRPAWIRPVDEIEPFSAEQRRTFVKSTADAAGTPVGSSGDLKYSLKSKPSKNPEEPGTFHGFGSECQGLLLGLTVVTPPGLAAEKERRVLRETIPKLLATARVEKPYAAAPPKADAADKDRDPAAVALWREAEAEARATLPEFDALLKRAVATRRPGPDHRGMVRARFAEGAVVEFLWLTDLTPAENGFRGQVANEPDGLKKVKLGDRVEVARDDVNDWSLVADAGLAGGYTIRLTIADMPADDQRAARKMFKLPAKDHDE